MKTQFASVSLLRRAARLLSGLPLLLWLAAGCGEAPAPASDKLTVVVSILPQVWFVEQIGGDLVDVTAMVGPGHSPATYEPTPRQLARLQTADIYFSIGVPFERGLLPKVADLPDAPPVAGPRPDMGAHDHGHAHGALDPHSWLSPQRAQALADTLTARLTTLRPDRAVDLAARRADLGRRLTDLDAELQALLAPVAGRSFFVFHPAFGHFAEAYGLHQVAVEDDGHEPGPRQMAALIDQAAREGATAIVIQPQFSRKSAATVADAAGLEIVELDPLGADYPANLRHIARTLVRILEGSAP